MENENKIENKTDIVSDTEPKATAKTKTATGAKSKSTTGTKSAAGTKSKSASGTKSATGTKAKSTSGTKSAAGAKSKSTSGTKSATGTKAKSASGTKSKSATAAKSKTESKPEAESDTEPKTEVVTETETTETEAAAATEAAAVTEAETQTETEIVTESAATEEEAATEEVEPEKEPVEENAAEPEKEPVTENEIMAAVETSAEAKPAAKSKPKFNLKAAIIGVVSVIVIVAVILISTLVSCEGNATKYTVTFDTRGGSPVSSYKLEAGEKINRPSVTPKKEMFVFYDWFTDTTYTEKFTFGTKMPKNDITIYAGWIGEASVEIKLNANGGTFTGGDVEYKLYGDVGAAFAMPSVKPTKTGYAFGGWYLDAECTDSYTFTVFPVENLTLYASWVKDATYAYISYYGNGLLISEVPVIKSTVISEPSLFGSDIISAGWYTDEAMTKSYTFGTVTSDISLYTTYYTKGLEIENGVVTGYTGDSASVIVPNKYDGTTVTEIGEYAFYRSGEATSIISVSLPATITVVAKGAFYDCQYLVGVGLTSNVTSIGDNAFYKNYRLKTVGDISAVIEIGEAAFIGCKVLGNITLSSSLESLGAYAFTDCETITSMVIPSAIHIVPDYLFSGCKALKTVEILSARLDTIGAHAFENCKALELVTIRSQIAATIEDENGISTFNGLDDVKIKVLAATLDFYRSEYIDFDFGTLADKFEAI
ncbi:MAG: leucine-rich repeat protein [Clostridiales bacterium]|nr:leucine-rich repeat protein [Clostridiales bacterium]